MCIRDSFGSLPHTRNDVGRHAVAETRRSEARALYAGASEPPTAASPTGAALPGEDALILQLGAPRRIAA
eukprot:11016437-Alexandrium_andersonii.AAC.1